jgi:hypothetical protein
MKESGRRFAFWMLRKSDGGRCPATVFMALFIAHHFHLACGDLPLI